MFTLNRAELIGHLGADPEIRTFQNGGRVASFRVATSTSWKDKDENWQERTHWNTIVIFDDHLIKRAEKHLKKGTKVYVAGTLETREYQKGDQNHYLTEIVMRPFGNGDIKLMESIRNDDDNY